MAACVKNRWLVRTGRPAWWAVACAIGFTGGSGLAWAQDDALKPKVDERVKAATLFVKTFRSEREKADTPLGSGSGFFINNTGLLISNNHVVDPTHMKSKAEKQNFHYRGGKLTWKVVVHSGTSDEKTYEAVVLYQNETADQALLQAYEEDGKMLRSPHFLPLQPESKLRQRTKVWGLGFPGGDQQRTGKKSPPVQIEPGNILEFPRTPGGRVRKVYTDVLARPGNSGGPQVDGDGFLVGTATLMQAPEGREDSGGAKYTALVPARLTSDMVRNAFRLGKIPAGTDFTPFMDCLTEQSGQVNVPEYARLKDKDVLFFENGDRVYGKFEAEKLSLETDLGKIEVPSSAVAYIMNVGAEAYAYLEGGNRLKVSKVGESFAFVPDGGKKSDVTMADVDVISFRTGDRTVEPVKGEVVVLDGDLCHLVLTNIVGSAKFTGRAGTVEVPLTELDRIEPGPSPEERVIVLSDERRLTGKFEATPLKATIAATKTPVEFELSSLEYATVEVRNLVGSDVKGLSLTGILAGARRDFRKLAQTIESDKPQDAKPALDKLLEKSTFGKLPTLEKEQTRLLEAAMFLRTGNYAEATRTFRSAARSENVNIKVYSSAAAEVLKKYPDGKYEGKPLSDRAVFAAAGEVLAKDMLRQTRDAIKEVKGLEGDNKGDYAKAIAVVRKYDESMAVASVFLGSEPEDVMTRLWRVAMDAAEKEVSRLDEFMKEAQESSKQRGGPRMATSREIDEMRQKREEIIAKYRDYAGMRWEYGFWIEDPDVEEMRAKAADQDS